MIKNIWSFCFTVEQKDQETHKLRGKCVYLPKKKKCKSDFIIIKYLTYLLLLFFLSV